MQVRLQSSNSTKSMNLDICVGMTVWESAGFWESLTNCTQLYIYNVLGTAFAWLHCSYNMTSRSDLTKVGYKQDILSLSCHQHYAENCFKWYEQYTWCYPKSLHGNNTPDCTDFTHTQIKIEGPNADPNKGAAPWPKLRPNCLYNLL